MCLLHPNRKPHWPAPGELRASPIRGRLRSARYARLRSAAPGWGAQVAKNPITEETLHPQTHFPDDGENAALGTTVSSSVYAADEEPQALTDGDPDTVWRGRTPAEVTIDLGKLLKLTRIDLHLPINYRTARTQTLSISVSKDGGNAITVIEPAPVIFQRSNENMSTFDLKGTEARYVTISFEESDNVKNYAILAEIRIFVSQ